LQPISIPQDPPLSPKCGFLLSMLAHKRWKIGGEANKRSTLAALLHVLRCSKTESSG